MAMKDLVHDGICRILFGGFAIFRGEGLGDNRFNITELLVDCEGNVLRDTSFSEVALMGWSLILLVPTCLYILAVILVCFFFDLAPGLGLP